MPLTANTEVDHYIDQELRAFQIAAAKHLYKGSFVGLSTTGYAQPLTASDKFIGIAYEEMDNTSGADGDLSLRVYTIGDFGLSLSGATTADVSRPVFASADDTLTFTAASNSYVGIAQDVVSPGEIILRLDTAHRQIKTILHPVENLAAGADIAARAIQAFDTDAWLISARIVNQATAAAGIDNLNTCAITLATGIGTVVTKSYDATTVFPAANTKDDLGALSNQHISGGNVLTLTVTNGATADPGPFLVIVDYV